MYFTGECTCGGRCLYQCLLLERDSFVLQTAFGLANEPNCLQTLWPLSAQSKLRINKQFHLAPGKTLFTRSSDIAYAEDQSFVEEQNSAMMVSYQCNLRTDSL